MKKTISNRARSRSKVPPDEILPEYDFRGARPNPYAARFAAGATVIVLDPDVAAVFSDSEVVNDALRTLAKLITTERARRVPRVSEGKPARR